MRIRTHANPLSYRVRLDPVDWSDIFSQYDGFYDLEIGFGDGRFLRRYAHKYPQKRLIGVEVRKAGAAGVANQVQEESFHNIYVVHSTAQIVLEDIIPDRYLERVFIFHPDPWLKKSHHKRRVISPLFLEVLAQKMREDGQLYISTDVSVLWDDMLRMIDQSRQFQLGEDLQFWEEDYETRWHTASKIEKRETFKAVFKLKKATW